MTTQGFVRPVVYIIKLHCDFEKKMYKIVPRINARVLSNEIKKLDYIITLLRTEESKLAEFNLFFCRKTFSKNTIRKSSEFVETR